MTPSSNQIKALVVDCDGVLRHWHDTDAEVAAHEVAAGLEPGTVLDLAFADPLGRQVMTGELTWEQWVEELRRQVGSDDAVRAFVAGRGEVDPAMVDLVAEAREAGLVTGVLSNATTRFEEDLEVLGLAPLFDHVFNTARMGVAKPDPEVYRRVVAELGCRPGEIVFTDDHPGWAEAAGAIGIVGIHFTDAASFRARLVDLGALENP